jgi:iron-sulfur cluster insertion protein
LRVYITGGGCSGFSYGFTFDDKQKEGDSGVAKNGVQLVVDGYFFSGTVTKNNICWF